MDSRERQGRDVRGGSNQWGSPFDSFAGFGSQRSMFPSLFGGRDPFDDPFFTRPFGTFSGPSMFNNEGPGNSHNMTKLEGPLIEELDGDDERMSEENKDDPNSNPLVEHPEDQHKGNGKSKSNENQLRTYRKSKSNENQLTTYRTDHNKVEGTKSQTRSVSFQRVTYGGVNGTYYTASTTRRTGNDGVTLEESKQADKTTGQATHRISRGIHDKGHSVTRKLDSDGKVDTKQTLHNLNEDELTGFEQAWKGNVGSHFLGQNEGFDFPEFAGVSGGRRNQMGHWEGFGDHFREHFGRNGRQNTGGNFQTQASTGRPKKTIRINIE